MARDYGLIDWSLAIKNVRDRKYKDTLTCRLDGWRAMIGAIQGRDAVSLRDRAMLRLMWDRGMRRKEVASLDLADVDLERKTIRFTGKGEEDDEVFALAAPTADAIRDWIAARGSQPGPLFVGLSRNGARLNPGSIYRIVRDRGRAVGIDIRPHGIRHAVCTSLLDAGHDLVGVSQFMRHGSLDTTMIYDKNRKRRGDELANAAAQL